MQYGYPDSWHFFTLEDRITILYHLFISFYTPSIVKKRSFHVIFVRGRIHGEE